MAGKLDGKTAIITGAGRGIGREVAMLFAQQGARVIVNDLGSSVAGEGEDTSPAAQTVADIKAAGGEAIAHFGDVSDMDQAEDIVRTALNEWGQLDILVNVAGILRDRMIFNMTEEEWDAVVRVHMKGTFATTRFASMHWRQARERRPPDQLHLRVRAVRGARPAELCRREDGYLGLHPELRPLTRPVRCHREFDRPGRIHPDDGHRPGGARCHRPQPCRLGCREGHGAGPGEHRAAARLPRER